MLDLRSNSIENDGETSLPKWKPTSAETVGQLPQMSKLQRKSEPGLAVVGTNDHPPEIWYNNFLVPTSTMNQRRTKHGCHRTIWTTREPATSHQKRLQILRASLGFDSNVRHHHR